MPYLSGVFVVFCIPYILKFNILFKIINIDSLTYHPSLREEPVCIIFIFAPSKYCM